MDIVHKPPKLVKDKYVSIYKNRSILRWPINGVIQHARNYTNFKSENFELNGLGSKFYLHVYPSHPSYGHLDYYLYVADMGTEKQIELTCRFWLQNVYGEKCAETKAKTAKVTQNGGYVAFENVLTHDEILSKASFFKSDKATVRCEIIYEVLGDVVEPSIPILNDNFRQKLWDSYAKGFCSVTIKVEGQELKVSKAVLTANSDVFERMFSTANCIETQTGIIDIKDIKANVMEDLIQYMYLGKVDNIEPIAVDLLKAADKYNVSGLKDLCGKAIAKTLTGETFFDVIVLAYMYKCDALKNAVCEFIVANPKARYFNKLISSSEWRQFSDENKELALEILTDVFNRINAGY